MIFLPRLARSLHHPALAGLLGLILIGIGVYGLSSGHIPKVWSILILVVGAINLLRLVVRHPEAGQAGPEAE